MLSDRELQVLRRLPGKKICYTCVVRIASLLPDEPEPIPSELERNFRHWMDVCSQCGQFAKIARFVPPENPPEKKKNYETA
jgi:hypothetical protein